mmetsp:Transcript_22406/g.67131  ORF Transcript_22406/g.67131 Transcript_22406/m.67131 type:complete len:247 (-) Transcript_22406:2606-3346(-)
MEVERRDVLQPAWRRREVVYDRVLERRRAEVRVLRCRRGGAVARAARGLAARLVEVGLRDEDLVLDTQQHLPQRARLRRPLLGRVACVPRTQQREADLAVSIQIRIEAHSSLARRDDGHERRDCGVRRREPNVEDEEAARVRRPRRPRHAAAAEVQPRLVEAHPDRAIRVGLRQVALELPELLLERSRVGRAAGARRKRVVAQALHDVDLRVLQRRRVGVGAAARAQTLERRVDRGPRVDGLRRGS